MLQFNPSERFNLEEILSHPWMQGPVPEGSDIVKEFKERKKLIDRSKDGSQGDSKDKRDLRTSSVHSILEDSEFLAWERTAETPTLS